MKQDDFEDYIKTLQNKEYTTSRRPSLIVNNFYSLITIIIISISILIYTNYVVPAQKSHKEKMEKYDNSH
jgi:hypothetical protein